MRRFAGTIRGGIDNDYKAVLERASFLGYSLPSANQQEKDLELIASYKEFDLWNSFDLFYQFRTDADSDFATLNWKDPLNFQCQKINNPLFEINLGFRGNGTSYLNTGWKPLSDGINYTLNQNLIATYENTDVAENTTLYGSRNANGTNSTRLITKANSATTWGLRNNNNTTLTRFISNSIGSHLVNRINSTEINIVNTFSGSVQLIEGESTGVSNFDLYILATNSGGSPIFQANRSISYFAIGNNNNISLQTIRDIYQNIML